MVFMKIGTIAGGLDKIALTVGIVMGFLFGGWTELLTALLVLHLLDIITGVLAGGKGDGITSSKMDAGLKKKLGSWIALILANVIDGVLFDGQGIALTGMVIMFISNEGLSIIENLGLIGVPIPKAIRQYLTQIREQADKLEYTLGEPPVPPVEKVTVEDEAGHVQELHNNKGE